MDYERKYCLRVEDGHFRAGCQDFTAAEALEHWGEKSDRSQPAYIAAIMAYLENI